MTTAVQQDRQRGAALILVLWSAIFVSTALAVAIHATRIEARIEAARLIEFKQRLAAEDGLKYAAQAVARSDRPFDDVIRSLQYSSNGYDVTFTPSVEAQKIDMNYASEAQFAQLFVYLGVDKDIAPNLAARVADWRDPDDLSRPNGAERIDYARAQNGERIGNRPFYSTDDLTLVLGMPEDVAQCAKSAVTIFGSGASSSSAAVDRLFGRSDETAEYKRLGTASRAASAGQRHAVDAVVGGAAASGRVSIVRTGIFRITGNRRAPVKWIAMFDQPHLVNSHTNCF